MGAGFDLKVTDHQNGAERRAAERLSGGEGFTALLALGLSESAERARNPIEALFIAEGFGSLGPATVSEVTHPLHALPAVAGCLVGVVRDVEDLKRLIPVLLLVSPGVNGSELRVGLNRAGVEGRWRSRLRSGSEGHEP